MAVCPECKAEIEDLDYVFQIKETGKLLLESDGQVIQDSEESTMLDKDRFYCPECTAELFDNGVEAEKFLLQTGKGD